MKYFLLEPDLKLQYVPKIDNWYQNFDEKNLTPEKYDNLPERVVLFTTATEKSIFPSIYVSPFFLLNDEMKDLVSLYEPNMQFTTFALLNKKYGVKSVYHLPKLPVIDCLAKESKLNLNRSIIIDGILEADKIPDKSVFLLGNVTDRKVVVRLDLLESMLRRNVLGITFKELSIKE